MTVVQAIQPKRAKREKRKRRSTEPGLMPEPSARPVQIADIAKSEINRSRIVNEKVLRRVRAYALGDEAPTNNVEKGLTLNPGAEPEPSKTTGEDPLASMAERGLTIENPFDMLTLATLPENNSELTQCIDAMITNIDTTGHRFIPRLQVESAPTELQANIQVEHVRLQNFFQYVTDEAFTEFRGRLRWDKETTGNCYFEVVRDSKSMVQSFNQMPSYQMRLGRMEDDPVLVTRKITELQPDNSVKIVEVPEWRRFRVFVQSRFITSRGLNSTVQGHKVRWFKSFGDPRHYDSETGLVESKSNPVSVEKRANEVIWMKMYSPRTPYGLPRFIGNLLSIFGDRASEEINYTTFRNNNIPSMAILVSNGQLTEGSLQRIESFVESQIQGSDNWSKFLLIEGEPIEEDGDDGGQFKIEIKPLTADQHTDALFQHYSANNQDKVRRSFRLPPIFVGKSDDYTRSTAEASRRLADEQIFAPERQLFDDMINRFIFPDMGVIYHKYKSNTPNTTDNAQLVKILSGSEKTGGMTPQISRTVMEDILGVQLPPFPPDFPKDVPFSLTMAERVKNMAPAPAEPGQSVTAISGGGGDKDDVDKRFDDDDDDDDDDEEAEDSLRALSRRLEKRIDKLWADREAD